MPEACAPRPAGPGVRKRLEFLRSHQDLEVQLARITIEDCLKRVENRFMLVHMAASRVRQIREGSEYLVSSPKNEDIVVALRELAAGKVRLKKPTADE